MILLFEFTEKTLSLSILSTGLKAPLAEKSASVEIKIDMGYLEKF